jgi:hypothetical protein
MALRLALAAALLFWGVMNVLLWRSEYGGARHGGAVPVERVLGTILTAPDDSPLAILHRGRRVGTVRWVPAVIEPPPGGGGFEPEGLVRQKQGYRLTLDGNVYGEDVDLRLRFNGQAVLGPDRTWRAFQFRAGFRPLFLDVEADATNRVLRVRREDGDATEEFRYAFDELRRPQRLLADLGGAAWLPLVLGNLRLPDPAGLAAGVRAEAAPDWLRVGEARLRVFRLTLRGPDRREAVLHVSRVGEILKVALPGQVALVHESLLPP